MVGVYPRWVGTGTLAHPSKDYDFKTFFTLGDSRREIRLGIAPGFPQIPLAPGEIILPAVLGEYFGITDQDGNPIVAEEDMVVDLTLDLLDIPLG